MQWYTVLGIVSSILGLCALLWGGVRYWHKQAVKAVANELRPIMAEVSHNGGSSLKDQVVDMRAEMRAGFAENRAHMRDQDRRIDDLYKRL